jgi:hypothetical protein
MKRPRTTVTLIAIAFLAAGMVLGWRLGAVHRELSDSYGMAWLMQDVWTERSGSEKHDLRIDLVFGAAINQIRALRTTVAGRIAEPYILGGSSLASEHARSIHQLHIVPGAPGVTRPSKESSSEQTGTGQPATRSESDLEGRDKPQPEADGRSR